MPSKSYIPSHAFRVIPSESSLEWGGEGERGKEGEAKRRREREGEREKKKRERERERESTTARSPPPPPRPPAPPATRWRPPPARPTAPHTHAAAPSPTPWPLAASVCRAAVKGVTQGPFGGRQGGGPAAGRHRAGEWIAPSRPRRAINLRRASRGRRGQWSATYLHGRAHQCELPECNVNVRMM